MAIASNLNLTGYVSGAIEGAFTIGPLTFTGTVLKDDTVDLSNGANTITPPTGCTKIICLPPASNAVAWTLKGVSGDTGIGCVFTDWAAIPIKLSVSASFNLYTGGSITGFRFLYL